MNREWLTLTAKQQRTGSFAPHLGHSPPRDMFPKADVKIHCQAASMSDPLERLLSGGLTGISEIQSNELERPFRALEFYHTNCVQRALNAATPICLRQRQIRGHAKAGL